MTEKYTAQGLTYPEACALIDKAKASGIEANITVGGISFYPEADDVALLFALCKDFGITPFIGNTFHQERILNPAKAHKWANDRARAIHGVELGLDETGA